MTKWLWTGIKTGKKTTAYPVTQETACGVSPGRPAVTEFDDEDKARAVVNRCPAGALHSIKNRVEINRDNCLNCLRCGSNDIIDDRSSGFDSICSDSTGSGSIGSASVDSDSTGSAFVDSDFTGADSKDSGSMRWENSYEWAEFNKTGHSLRKSFSGSLNIRILDAGACGACMGEIKQITGPYYNIHRLGFFITPTPRMADILLVAGPLTEHMVDALKKTWDAMPAPRRVIAVGTCAISGGPFGSGFASKKGIEQVVPVDIKIPGCPPPPLAIIHALLLASGRLKKIPGQEKTIPAQEKTIPVQENKIADKGKMLAEQKENKTGQKKNKAGQETKIAEKGKNIK